MNRRHLFFFLLFVPAFLMAYTPIKVLYNSSPHWEYFSHILLIPLVSIYLIFQNRKTIFSEQEYLFRTGMPVLLLGALLYVAGQGFETSLSRSDSASIKVFSAVIFINGAFVLCYGFRAYKAALFPLLFLLFVVPIPIALMDSVIYVLQVGSTEITNILFAASGVPYLREGFVFHLPGMSVEVAKQCSGIMSTLALLITSVLAGHMFLKTGWKKVLLAVLVIPVTMIKNGIRILIITLLGTYVDPRWVTESGLHRDGGIVFFIMALALMAPALYWLRKGE